MHGLDNFKRARFVCSNLKHATGGTGKYIRKSGRGRKIISLSRKYFCHKTEKTEKDREQKKSNVFIWTTIIIHKLNVEYEEEK
jgi:hypothetical protein